jgi:hypothetical protein
MKYLCLICAETVMEHMTEAESARQYREYAAFTEDIKRHGHFISANRLKPVDTATTLRVRNGQVTVTDGPFAETKEQFGGYYVIEARDLNEAIQVAAKILGRVTAVRAAYAEDPRPWRSDSDNGVQHGQEANAD